MKKFTLTIFLSILLFTAGISQPPDGIWDKDESPTILKRIAGDCIELTLDLGKQLIVQDCPEYDYFEFDSDKSYDITIEPVCLEQNCLLEIQLFFNDILLYDKTVAGFHTENSAFIPIDYEYLESLLGPNFEGREAELRLEITKKCYKGLNGKVPSMVIDEPIFEIFPIQVRKPGEQYEADIAEKPYGVSVCEELYNNDKDKIREIDLCCQGTLHADYTVSKISGTNVSINGTISKMEPLAALGLNVSISYSITEFDISQSIVSHGVSYSESPQGDQCIFPGILLSVQKHEKSVWQVNCDLPDTKIKVLEEYEEVIEISPYLCKYDYDCPDQDPKPQFDANLTHFGMDDCLYDLSMTLIDPVPNMSYEFEWTGPDGTHFYETDLEGVPYGKYELTVFDECCNEYSYTYNLCDELYYGAWYYENDQYCREVSCSCEDIVTFREESIYTMCVEPHRYDETWIFDSERKKCIKHAYWTDQFGVEIDLTNAVGEADIEAQNLSVVKEPSSVIEYFDESMNQCIREYFCEEDYTSIYQEESDPTYGNWGYDEVWENCYREILCFGEEAKDENGFEIDNDLIDATYGEWEYDEFWDQCSRKIYCAENHPVDDWGEEIIEKTDEVTIDWNVETDFDFGCVGIIYCDDDETDIELEVEPEAEWDLDIYGNCISTSLFCEEEEQENMEETPDIFGNWEYDDFSELCYQTVHCATADEWFYYYVLTNFWPDYDNQGGCNEELGEYSYQLICDAEESDIYTCRNQPYDEFFSQIDNADVNKYQFKSDELILSENHLPGEYEYYILKIYSLEGKPVKTIKLYNLRELQSYLRSFNLSNSKPNQLFVYSLYGEHEFLYARKFSILK